MCLIWWNPLSSFKRSIYSAASGGQGHILCAAVSPTPPPPAHLWMECA